MIKMSIKYVLTLNSFINLNSPRTNLLLHELKFNTVMSNTVSYLRSIHSTVVLLWTAGQQVE